MSDTITPGDDAINYAGEEIEILAGGEGAISGGGTFVFSDGSGTLTPLVVAGGLGSRGGAAGSPGGGHVGPRHGERTDR